MKRKRNVSDLRTIYLLAIANALAYILVFREQVLFDTPTYVDAWDNFREFKVDSFRTLVYPAILGAFTLVFGSKYLIYVVFLQYAVFFLSISYLYRLVQRFSQSRVIAFCLVLFYAVYPGIVARNNAILTESLSVSCSVFLLYQTLRAYETDKIAHYCQVVFWIFFLLFLRPAFVYLLPVYAVFWLLQMLKRRKIRNAIAGIAGIALISGALCLYMRAFHASFGIYATSQVSAMNQFVILCRNELFRPEEVENKEFAQFLEGCLEQEKGITTDSESFFYTKSLEAIDHFGVEEVDRQVHEAMHRHFLENLQRTGEVFLERWNDQWFSIPPAEFHTPYDHILNLIIRILRLLLSLLYLIIACFCALFAYYSFRRKNFPLFSFLLVMLGVSNIVVAVLGAYNVWGRLVLPSIPIYLLMLAALLSFMKLGKASAQLA